MSKKKGKQVMTGWAAPQHQAFSDFAHLPTPAMCEYALSLGNEGVSIEKMKAARAAKAKAKAKAQRKAKAAAGEWRLHGVSAR